jgi:hypothetical protein
MIKEIVYTIFADSRTVFRMNDYEIVRPQQTATANGIFVEILSDVPSVEKNQVTVRLGCNITAKKRVSQSLKGLHAFFVRKPVQLIKKKRSLTYWFTRIVQLRIFVIRNF